MGREAGIFIQQRERGEEAVITRGRESEVDLKDRGRGNFVSSAFLIHGESYPATSSSSFFPF